MPIKAIVFDMDDTLYREKEYVYSGFKHLDQWVQMEYGVKGFLEHAWNYFCSNQNKNIFNQVLTVLHIPFDEQLIAHLVKMYRSHLPDIQLLEEAEWVLSRLTKDRIKVGLLSDGYLIAQKNKIKALKLTDRFHAIVLSDELGREHWKPSASPYERICHELGVSHRDCVYIGDNVTKDFITAKRLGWITVHVDRQDGVYSGIQLGTEYEAHYKIYNLKEILSLDELQKLWVEEVGVR